MQGATVDLDARKEHGVQQPAVERPVGAGKRETVEEKRHAAAGRCAVQAGATDDKTRRFEAAEAFLQEETGHPAQGLAQGREVAAGPGLVARHGCGTEGGGKGVVPGGCRVGVHTHLDQPGRQGDGVAFRLGRRTARGCRIGLGGQGQGADAEDKKKNRSAIGSAHQRRGGRSRRRAGKVRGWSTTRHGVGDHRW